MKHYLITSGVYKLFLSYKKELYLTKQDYNNKELYLNVIPDMEFIQECFKIYNATTQRKKNNLDELCRWCFAINFMPSHKNYKLIFGTLTFKDKVLEKTQARTRQRYVTKFLNENTIHYIANIDFGEKNNREHYHFVAMVEDKINGTWNYGARKFQFIPIKSKDIKSCKNYLLKLNNHSYKDTTKQARIIKDRKEDLIIDFLIKALHGEEFHKFKLKLINE